MCHESLAVFALVNKLGVAENQAYAVFAFAGSGAVPVLYKRVLQCNFGSNRMKHLVSAVGEKGTRYSASVNCPVTVTIGLECAEHSYRIHFKLSISAPHNHSVVPPQFGPLIQSGSFHLVTSMVGIAHSLRVVLSLKRLLSTAFCCCWRCCWRCLLALLLALFVGCGGGAVVGVGVMQLA